MLKQIKSLTDEIFDEVVNIRRTFHKKPEMAFHEYETSDMICAYLDKLKIPYKRGIAKTGVVALIEVGSKAKTLLIRSDIDALPVLEENDCDYKSQNEGYMHACGHDGHMAILLGCATIFMRLKDHLKCNIKLVFQPAEEAAGGAEPMIKEGVMENPKVDAAIGYHIMNDTEVGKVMVKTGPLMASPDDFDLVIHGKGGHGAYPHACIDPIIIGCNIVNAFQALTARFVTPLEPKVLSVCSFQGGSFYNVIPDDVKIKGTVRTFDKELREKMPKMMEDIVDSITKAFGAKYEFNFIYRYPPLINDESITIQFAQTAKEMLGEENVVWGKYPSMGGEDFSYFANEVPATYFNVGSRNESKGITMPLHNSNFQMDEECLRYGIRAVCNFAFHFGEKN